jgi:diaminopimelate epimerase
MIEEEYNLIEDNNIINFQKYSGCGNDFIMINTETEIIPKDLNNFVKKVCQRGSNIGADGVILMTLSYEEIYDAKWVYYNSDGSMAKMCGNGLRCAAKYVYDNTGKKSDLKLITGDGLISNASLLKNGDIYVTIPIPKMLDIDDELRRLIENILDKDLIMKTPDLSNIYRIDVSVPHIVIILKSLDALNNINVNSMGKIVNDLIPDFDVNVNFVAVSNEKFYIRTFERGVFAETLACGTGCCSFAFIIYNFLKIDEIFINVKSGDKVRIFFKENSIYLEGKANIIYKGVIDLKN